MSDRLQQIININAPLLEQRTQIIRQRAGNAALTCVPTLHCAKRDVEITGKSGLPAKPVEGFADIRELVAGHLFVIAELLRLLCGQTVEGDWVNLKATALRGKRVSNEEAVVVEAKDAVVLVYFFLRRHMRRDKRQHLIPIVTRISVSTFHVATAINLNNDAEAANVFKLAVVRVSVINPNLHNVSLFREARTPRWACVVVPTDVVPSGGDCDTKVKLRELSLIVSHLSLLTSEHVVFVEQLLNLFREIVPVVNVHRQFVAIPVNDHHKKHRGAVSRRNFIHHLGISVGHDDSVVVIEDKLERSASTSGVNQVKTFEDVCHVGLHAVAGRPIAVALGHNIATSSVDCKGVV